MTRRYQFGVGEVMVTVLFVGTFFAGLATSGFEGVSLAFSGGVYGFLLGSFYLVALLMMQRHREVLEERRAAGRPHLAHPLDAESDTTSRE